MAYGACNILTKLLTVLFSQTMTRPANRRLTLLLLVLRIGADDHHASVATNDFALLAHGFN